jgi:sigma-B regulation protein RsbU (phosphoserine phosphatase)
MFGLRYRLLFLLIGSSLVVLLAYFSIARVLFEGDKFSVIYDTLFEATSARAEKIDHHLQHHFAMTKALMISRQSMSQSAAFRYLLQLSPQIKKAWFVQDLSKVQKKPLHFVAENLGNEVQLALDAAFETWLTAPAADKGILPVGNSDYYLIWEKVDGSNSYLILALEWPELRKWLEEQVGLHFLLADAKLEPVWLAEKSLSRDQRLLHQLLQDSKRNWNTSPEQTFETDFENEKMLISTVKIPAVNARLVALANHGLFFKPLEELRTNSILFVIFVISIFSVISVFLAQSVAKKLELLTVSAEQVSAGNFDVQVQIDSKDEVGTLGKSFNIMVARIRDLIKQTAHKARMESELRTAQAVQKTLFPKSAFKAGKVELAGSYESASECGGDWWYYFLSGKDLFVFQCDATGHGAPAALMTSSARAIVSVIQHSGQFELTEVAQKLSNGLFDVFKGELMMTAFLMRVNIETGHAQYINASHENPVILRQNQPENEFVSDPVNARLGESESQKFLIGELQLQSGDRLIVYTDGLFAVENPEGKMIGERRGLNKLVGFLQNEEDLEEGLVAVNTWLKEYRGEMLIPDDITLISLRLS